MIAELKPVILIVDDDDIFREQLESFLLRDFDVVSASNGLEALEHCAGRCPELVIADVAMSPIDGYELCHQIKTRPESSLVPVILLTGETNRQRKIRGLIHGADDYLGKPFDPDELLARIRNLLKVRLLQKELFQSAYLKSTAQLVTGLAHELNNPLGFLVGNLTALEDGLEELLRYTSWLERNNGNKPESEPDAIDRIEIDEFRAEHTAIILAMKSGADRITRIVKALRDLVQNSDNDESRVAIAESLHTMIGLVAPLYPGVDVNLQIQLSTVEKWPIAINHAVQQIVLNAMESFEGVAGSHSKTVEIVASREGDFVGVRVRDSGPGIPEERQSRVWAPFYSTKAAHPGIGLSLAHGIVSRYGGDLSYESHPGITEFRMLIRADL